uniref:Glycosyltransferase family 92 protein n=1 Tax=viral metagenome TaxID=1070528 RepID=A0A6C0DKS8_9ZZZZ
MNFNYNLVVPRVCLFTNARDETHIKEWAAHHLLIGFTKIIIFDHKSKLPLSNVFSNFDKRVEIVNVSHMENPIKMKLMNMALEIARKMNMDWMIYLDADEFLVIHNNYKGVKHLLSRFNFASALAVNWLMFGSNYLEKEPEGLIMDNYTKSELYLNEHVKTFVRPTHAVNAINPHYYIMTNTKNIFGTNKKKLEENFYKNDNKTRFYESPAYIAHYLNQSEETFIKRKINLPSDDTGTNRNFNIHQIKEIHNQYNDGENTQPKIKYANQIKQFLEKYK